MRVAVHVVMVLSIGGCGDDLGVDIDTSASNICSEVAEVTCHNLYQCCTEGEIENFLRVDDARTESQCRDDVRRICQRSLATVQDSIDAGRVRFDANLMNTCLQALVAPDETCAEVVDALPWTEACMNTAWIGTVATGDACRFTHDCASAGDATCGPAQRCVSSQGQPCGTGCGSAFYCAGTTCQPRLPVDAPCSSGDACRKELFCDYGAPTPICTTRGGSGAACTSPYACVSGQCVPGTCAGQSGNTCYRDTDCPRTCSNSPAFCAEDYQCGVGHCQVSNTACSFPSDCGGSETCVLPGQCLPAACLGDPVCTAPQFTIDYCEDAIQQIPGI